MSKRLTLSIIREITLAEFTYILCLLYETGVWKSSQNVAVILTLRASP
jgi:hypothetical protein